MKHIAINILSGILIMIATILNPYKTGLSLIFLLIAFGFLSYTGSKADEYKERLKKYE